MTPTDRTNFSVNTLCDWLKIRPIAHRGLHDMNRDVYENTISAAVRAIEMNFSIEMDLQWTADGVPVVFHDFTLKRLTSSTAALRETGSSDVTALTVGNSRDRIPTLRRLLDSVDGKVGLVLELKGEEGSDDGFVEAVIRDLEGYDGNVALMSFDHHLLRNARACGIECPLGLTAMGRDSTHDMHRAIIDELEIDFLSWHVDDLPNQLVSQWRQAGLPATAWTVRTDEQLETCIKYCDQPTFEGILI